MKESHCPFEQWIATFEHGDSADIMRCIRLEDVYLRCRPISVTQQQFNKMSNRNIDVAFLNKPGYADTTSSSSSSTTSKTQTKTSTPTQTVTATSTASANSLYPYTPSIPIGGVFSALYFLIAIYHFYLSVWKPLISNSVNQKHKYTIPLSIASLISTLGFANRLPSVATEQSRGSFGLYGVSQVCIIIAPIFICAALYLMISHLIRLCRPAGNEQNFLRLNPEVLGAVLVVSNVLCFLLQGAGTAIAASAGWKGDKATLGKDLLLIGLVAQLTTLTLFLIVLGMFCVRVKGGHREEHDLSRTNSDFAGRDFGFNPLAKEVVKGMWIAGVLLEVRSVYRVAQFGMGPEGYLFHHEWSLWVSSGCRVRDLHSSYRRERLIVCKYRYQSSLGI